MASPTTSYSREETIAAITEFYQFFIRLPSVDPSALVIAPANGWIYVPTEELTKRGKSNEAIEILRWLPYLNYPNNKGWTINDGCYVIQYHRGKCYSDIHDKINNLPGYVIPIAWMMDRNGSCLLLDTQSGHIIEYSIMANNIQGDREEYDKLDEKDQWKAFPSAPARKWFGRWKKLYEELIWMVAPTTDGNDDVGQYFSRADNVEQENEMLEEREHRSVKSGRDDEETNEMDENEYVEDEDAEIDDGDDNADLDHELGYGDEEFEHEIPEMDRMIEDQTNGVYEIYKRNGWPMNFDREACKTELIQFLKELPDDDSE